MKLDTDAEIVDELLSLIDAHYAPDFTMRLSRIVTAARKLRKNEPVDSCANLRVLAGKLAMALADEVASTGDPGEMSVDVLIKAREVLHLRKEFNQLDNLTNGQLHRIIGE